MCLKAEPSDLLPVKMLGEHHEGVMMRFWFLENFSCLFLAIFKANLS